MLSDTDIMVRVQGGDLALFGELVNRYQSRLLLFARSKFADRDFSEDLVQDAFLAAYQARDSYRVEFAFSTWIWTILLNLSKEAGKKQARRQDRERKHAQLSHERAGLMTTPLQEMLAAEQRTQVHLWLQSLPEEEADAIRLKFFGGLKYEEIAWAMESSVSGAKARVRRGLTRLAEQFPPDD
ncbi:MAG: sigma-70 family RNA polymerase sigma factor [Planctomycetaceae bacterium]|nr:sigma-70 family RNA polymerase sigma factor [Planctomycetaceae bacterium]